jgi:hypothetical protein
VPEPDATLHGRLQGGVVAPGGETTGYELLNVTIEVDMSDVENVDALDGQTVKLNGHFETREGPERGTRWVFKAHGTAE